MKRTNDQRRTAMTTTTTTRRAPASRRRPPVADAREVPRERLSKNGRPVRVGCLVRAVDEGAVGVVTYVAGNVVVYKVLPGPGDEYSAEFRHDAVVVLLDAAEPTDGGPAVAGNLFWDAVGRLVEAGAAAARAAIAGEGPDACMIFEAAEGGGEVGKLEPVPLLPMDVLGRRRIPDGRTVLTLAQAAERFGRSPDRLRKLWRATWGDVWGEPAAAVPAMPTAGAGRSRRRGKGRGR